MSNTELKKVKGRVQNKHKTETEWLLDVYPNGDRTQSARTDAFIPLAGELIIYDPDSVYDFPRLKIGDGKTYVTDLPFTNEVLNKYQTKIDENLTTESKEIVVAINELNEKADTAIQTVTSGIGLKTTKTGTELTISFDDEVVFIFDGGDLGIPIVEDENGNETVILNAVHGTLTYEDNAVGGQTAIIR